MKKYLRKNIHWLTITVIFFVALIYGFIKTETIEYPQNKEQPALHFLLKQETDDQRINIYLSDNGYGYVFLPSYTDLSQLKVVTNKKSSILLGDIPVIDGMDCSCFSLETSYDLVIDNCHEAKLKFCKSENVATLFINTASGNMDYVHKDLNYAESVQLSLYNDEGVLNYMDTRAEIRGRGNSTWDYEKKPYTFTLSSEGDLLGMGEAENWILLANTADTSGLNNKIVLDVANRIDADLGPESDFVDFYLNGVYAGLYLLTEKVEVGENRLDINVYDGDFLCSVDLGLRWDKMDNPFLTNHGRAIEIRSPERLTTEDTEKIRELTNQMEEVILSGRDISQKMDLNSWARKYLIDEIFGNIDADLTSSYFYYTDGMFYGGPVWDYDMTFGICFRNYNPEVFLAKNAAKSEELLSPYYNALYNNSEFYDQMVCLYKTEFLPILEELLNGEIQNYADKIEAASKMNGIRWSHLYTNKYIAGGVSYSTEETIIRYLEKRVEFLNSAWLDNVPYCTVQFEYIQGSDYTSKTVVKGNCLNVSDEEVWYHAETGEIVDFDQPIMEDMIVTKFNRVNRADSEGNTVTTKDILVCLSAAAMIVLFLLFIGIDIWFRGGRGKVDAQHRTKISP